MWGFSENQITEIQNLKDENAVRVSFSCNGQIVQPNQLSRRTRRKTTMFKRFREEEGFTLIELLVVILIIAILIAVAAPSFLGQQDKAKESGTKQNLTVAYKAAKAASIDNTPQGSWGSDAALVASLEASEPQLDVVDSDTATATVDQVAVQVVAAVAEVPESAPGAGDGTPAVPETLNLRATSGSGAVCTLSAEANGELTPAACVQP